MSPLQDQNRDDIQRQRQPWQWGFARAGGALGYRGLGFALIPRLFNHRPARGKISTAFYAAFCPCFAEIGCWPTGIPIETVGLRKSLRTHRRSRNAIWAAQWVLPNLTSVDATGMLGQRLAHFPFVDSFFVSV